MTYARTSLDEIEPRELEGIEPTLLSVGYELRPAEMRPNVWRFEAGESNRYHRHGEQEELYVVLEGRFDVTVEDDEFELAPGDSLVVSPDTWRQLTATEDATLLVVGAPPVADDAEWKEME